MNNNKTLSVLCGALIATGLAGCGSDSAAPNLTACYTADGKGGTLGNLYEVDVTTGAMTTVGAIGYGVTGLAIKGSTLYAVESTNFGGTNRLLTIDTTTGAGTPVGLMDEGVGGGIANVADIAFSAGELYGWSENGDDLVTINTSTAVPTVIPSPLSTSGSGLTDIGGTLYFLGTNNLVTLDKVDGTGTIVGTPTTIGGNLNSATTSAGQIYSLDAAGGVGGNTSLVSIDPATAVLTEVAAYGSTQLDAIACP